MGCLRLPEALRFFAGRKALEFSDPFYSLRVYLHCFFRASLFLSLQMSQLFNHIFQKGIKGDAEVE
ncbi:MAG: hypothetical protein V2B19_00675 [Pseudomonadota bacterium]